MKMRLKLIRFANFFNPSFYRSFIVVLSVMAISAVCFKFRLDFVFSALAFLVIYSIMFPLFNYPKYIEFYNDCVCYVSPENLPRKHGKGFRSAKVSYQVTDITKFTLERNRIERLFGLAHLVFSGQTKFDAGKYTGQFHPKNVHCIYGISYGKHSNNITLYGERYLSNK